MGVYVNLRGFVPFRGNVWISVKPFVGRDAEKYVENRKGEIIQIEKMYVSYDQRLFQWSERAGCGHPSSVGQGHCPQCREEEEKVMASKIKFKMSRR